MTINITSDEFSLYDQLDNALESPINKNIYFENIRKITCIFI